ncbi:MAG: pectin acetylesterase-family hydrolase, partial [Oleiphilaceae bacterium]|nr:pectin acetylesterase-family hydrolase [Oleiphilaceae bacterium]
MKPSKFENTFLKALLLCFSLVITPVVWAVSAMETYYRYSPEGLEDKEPYQISPQNPEPVTEGNPDWKLYKFPRTVCLNNTQSTLAVNDFGKERQEQENLVVFFQGGNACFDPVSCSAAHWKNGYDWEHFIYQKDGSEKSDLNLNHEGQGAYDRGIFSTDASKSPYHGHSQVVVPYCSGDAYMGSAAPDQPTYIPGDGKTHGFETGRIVIYRGFYNVKEYIRWLAEQYPSAKNIVLIGQSAGSIGAMYHYKRFFDAFNSNSDPNQPLVEVSLVDDSGFMLQDGDVNYCARRAVQYFWNIDDGLRETLNLPEDEPVDVT